MLIFFDCEIVRDNSLNNLDKMEEKYGDKINFMPEFNKVLTICVGRFQDEFTKVIKNLEGTEEEQLQEFAKICKNNTLCGHNILSFDIPFIVKRMLKYQIDIPNELKFYGKKPRDITHIDTLDVWRMNYYGGFGNINLICVYLGITSPKDQGIDGSQVQAFHNEGKDNEIVEYCRRDTEAVMKLYSYFAEYNLI